MGNVTCDYFDSPTGDLVASVDLKVFNLLDGVDSKTTAEIMHKLRAAIQEAMIQLGSQSNICHMSGGLRYKPQSGLLRN